MHNCTHSYDWWTVSKYVESYTRNPDKRLHIHSATHLRYKYCSVSFPYIRSPILCLRKICGLVDRIARRLYFHILCCFAWLLARTHIIIIIIIISFFFFLILAKLTIYSNSINKNIIFQLFVFHLWSFGLCLFGCVSVTATCAPLWLCFNHRHLCASVRVCICRRQSVSGCAFVSSCALSLPSDFLTMHVSLSEPVIRASWCLYKSKIPSQSLLVITLHNVSWFCDTYIW